MVATIGMGEFPLASTGGKRRRSLKQMPVFSDLVAGVFTDVTREEIGIVSEVLRNKQGQVKYLVVDVGDEAWSRKIVLSAKRFYVDHRNDCVYACGMTKAQVEQLPTFSH
jgi:hypothetical protein